MEQRPERIKAKHLARKAVVYIRQSSDRQVVEHAGSTLGQRDQARYARMWGWPEEAIEIVDSDLGLSGSTAVNREGYLRLRQEIRRGQVGAVFIADVTRAGRDAEEWLGLIKDCKTWDVLLVVDGKIVDMSDTGERLLTMILAAIAEHDNDTLRQTMMRGRTAKAQRGMAVSPPPCGYVRDADGKWQKDWDPAVRGAIEAVFREFRKWRTLKKTVIALKQLGVRLPRRNSRGVLRWVEPQIGTIVVILKHPTYMGDYHFRRRTTDLRKGRDRRGRCRLRWALPEERIIIPDHHDPYVARKEWEDIQATLSLHAFSQTRTNPGPGSGILQGVIRCRRHWNRGMATIYKDPRPDGRRDHFYLCAGAYHLGGEQCGRIAGQRLDEAVVEAVRKRLGRPALEAIRLAWEEAKAGESAERHRVEVEVHRARQAEVEAAYRYQCVDPGNRLVAADLERKLEEAKREVRRVERLVAAQKEEPPTLDDDAFRELCELCGDFMALWNAKTTTNHDRKEIIRTIVKEVGVEEKGPAVVKLCVVWQDGEADTLIEARQARYGQKVIAELAAEGLASKEIAARLNAIGILTMRNRPWREQTVEKAIERMGRRGEERRHHAS